MRIANRAGGILLAGALLTVVFSAVSLRRDAAISDALSAEASHIDEIDDLAVSNLSSLKDAETGQRGYVITGKKPYLDPYNTGIQEFHNKMSALEKATAGDANLSAVVLEIARVGRLKEEELARVIAVLQSHGQQAAIDAVSQDLGKRYMDAFRILTSDLLAREGSALTRNREERRKAEESTRSKALISAIVLFLLTLAGTALLKVEVANERRLAEGLDLSQKKYRDLAESLDKQVEERTRELQQVNKELSAFSYSVSHDLRAPLRSIDGFSQIVLEDYSDHLDDSGRRLLERIRAAARRMGQLIQSLLELSRVTRLDLVRQTFSFSDMAAAVVDGLRAASPDRAVTVNITPDLWLEADPTLTRALLENLIQNAWKFTSKTKDARIEIGKIDDRNQAVFFVRDNGAGFDPAYADRLFTPFQRLHPESEFEGTGIGLATVQRVINRHAGRIWAESQTGHGATFFFALS